MLIEQVFILLIGLIIFLLHMVLKQCYLKKFKIPSLTVSLKCLVTDEDYRVMRLQELELLDEKYQASFDHMRVYQKCISKAFNKKVQPREF